MAACLQMTQTRGILHVSCPFRICGWKKLRQVIALMLLKALVIHLICLSQFRNKVSTFLRPRYFDTYRHVVWEIFRNVLEECAVSVIKVEATSILKMEGADFSKR
jgi:hypothetical protein